MPQIKNVAITKTISADGDFLILQAPLGETYKIRKSDFLAGLSTGSTASGGTTNTLPATAVFASHFDGADNAQSFVDARGNAITVNGNAKIDNSIKLFDGGSLLLNGDGYISAAYSPLYELGKSVFAISFFIRFMSLTAGAVINRYGGANSSFVIQTNGSGIDAYIYKDGGYIAVTGVNLDPNTTYYVGLKREKNVGDTSSDDGVLSLWVNGVQRGSTPITGYMRSSTVPLFIGAESDGGFRGRFRIDELIFCVGSTKDFSVISTLPFT